MNELTAQTVIEKPSSELTHGEKITFIVQELQEMDQVECPVQHRFAPGVYLREIFMPAGTVVIGKIHKTEHFNIIDKGRCLIVHDDGTRDELCGPMTFVSKAGVQKVLYILEDTLWKTIHVTEETDLVKLESLLIEPPPVVRITNEEPELIT
jgi:hypothetical protein